MTIANRLNELCKAKKMQKKVLAERIGVAASTFNTWIGRGEDFPAQYVMPICEALEITPMHLLTGDASPLPKIPEDYVKLDESERFLVDTYRSLDREGRVVVENKAVEEARRVRSEQGTGVAAADRIG